VRPDRVVAYNWGLDLVKQRLDQRIAGLDVEVPWTLPTLRREWNHRARPTCRFTTGPIHVEAVRVDPGGG
jgi:hypothetical protein